MSRSLLLGLSLITRLFFHLFAYVADVSISDYDTSESALNRPETGLLCDFSRRWVKWDAVYFMHIAEHQYDYEQMHAFYPGFPLLARAVWKVARWLPGADSGPCLLYFSGIVINNIAYLGATLMLYHLTLNVLEDVAITRLVVILWLITPATPFFLGL